MRAVVMRVERARVVGEGARVLASIGTGYVVLAGFEIGDTDRDAAVLGHRIGRLKLFPKRAREQARGLADVNGTCLVLPESSVIAHFGKELRPSFRRGIGAEAADRLARALVAAIEACKVPVTFVPHTGVVRLGGVFDGPLTFVLQCTGGKITT